MGQALQRGRQRSSSPRISLGLAKPQPLWVARLTLGCRSQAVQGLAGEEPEDRLNPVGIQRALLDLAFGFALGPLAVGVLLIAGLLSG